MSFTQLFPGMLLDAADRFAQDPAATQDFAGTDPIREMGWACTVVPEASGGVGGTLADLGSIVEGLATHGLHLPVVETCAVAPLLLQAAAPETAARWLEAVCEGSAKVAPMSALSASLDEIAVQARQLDIGYELTGAQSLSFAEAVGEIARATGRHIRFVSVSPEDYRAALQQAGLPDDVIALVLYLFTTVLDGRNVKPADGVQQALGRAPRSFADYVARTAATGVWNP